MKLCLAGTCSRIFQREELLKSDYILESFYYFKPWQHELIEKCDLFLLDSGAFTFMNNAKAHVDWDEYLNRYIDFINQNDIQYFFELDIDSVVGYDEVKRLRYKLENQTQKKCIPVWHKSRGINEFRKICLEYNYIAIGGIVNRELTKKDYPAIKKLVSYANSYGCRVHGLGFTNNEVFNYGFYSVDSTAWLSGSRHGTIYKFKNGSMNTYSAPEGKKLKHYKIIDRNNIREWIKYREHLKRF